MKIFGDIIPTDVPYNNTSKELRTNMSKKYLFEKETMVELLNNVDTNSFPRDALYHDIGTIGRVILSAMDAYTV